MPEPSNRGRKPGQVPGRYASGKNAEDHLRLAKYGTFDPTAFRVAEWLQFLAHCRRGLESKASGATLAKLLDEAGLPPRAGKVTHRRHPLMALAKAVALGVMNALLCAIENRDAKFFRELARRVKSTRDFYSPADPLGYALASYAARTKNRKNPDTLAMHRFARATQPGTIFDERTLRRRLKKLGFSLRPAGRPRKSDN